MQGIRHLLLAALLAAAVVSAAGRRLPTRRRALEENQVSAAVAGGGDALQNRYRWMTSLRHSTGPLKGDIICGGILIASNVLLTSASCTVPGWNIPRDATLYPWARIGTFKRRGGEYELRRTTATLIHAGWDRKANPVLNDIALLLLGGNRISSVPSLMTPIRLPPKRPKLSVKVGLRMRTLGFGDWGKPNVAPVLQEAVLPLQSQRTCRKEWPQFGKVWFNKEAICAGTKGKAPGICRGDYGGPLFIRGKTVHQDRLIGMSSFMGPERCGRGGLSGFTNVAAYRDWIDLGIKILNNKANATNLYKAYYRTVEPFPI